MESRNGGAGSAKRKHNCHAESNRVMLGAGWRGSEIVTDWGCRRCGGRWEEATTSAQMESQRIAEARDQVNAALRQPSDLRYQAALKTDEGVFVSGDVESLWDASDVARELATEHPGVLVHVCRNGEAVRSWKYLGQEKS